MQTTELTISSYRCIITDVCLKKYFNFHYRMLLLRYRYFIYKNNETPKKYDRTVAYCILHIQNKTTPKIIVQIILSFQLQWLCNFLLLFLVSSSMATIGVLQQPHHPSMILVEDILFLIFRCKLYLSCLVHVIVLILKRSVLWISLPRNGSKDVYSLYLSN